MKYRACYSRYHAAGVVFPVPDFHPRNCRVFIHKYAGRNITGLYSYHLYDTEEKAMEYIHGMMSYQERDERRRYNLGDARKRTEIYAHDWKERDVAVVARIRARNKGAEQ